jgi:hypothetical protein
MQQLLLSIWVLQTEAFHNVLLAKRSEPTLFAKLISKCCHCCRLLQHNCQVAMLPTMLQLLALVLLQVTHQLPAMVHSQLHPLRFQQLSAQPDEQQ